MRNIVSLFAFAILTLAALAWLILGRGVYEPLVPDPEDTVHEFIGEFSAGRYEPARRELTDELKTQITVQDLEELDRKLKDKFGGYDYEPGGQEQRAGDRASYDAKIETDRRGTQQVPFQLARDSNTGLWEISSLESLQAAAEH